MHSPSMHVSIVLLYINLIELVLKFNECVWHDWTTGRLPNFVMGNQFWWWLTQKLIDIYTGFHSALSSTRRMGTLLMIAGTLWASLLVYNFVTALFGTNTFRQKYINLLRWLYRVMNVPHITWLGIFKAR